MKSEPLRTALAGFILISVVYFVFSPSISNGFLLFDDDRYVTDNALVLKGISQNSLLDAFSTNLLGNWQPLTFLSHALDVQLWGLDPKGHHFTSLLLHCLNALLLFLLALRMGANRTPAFFGSLLFALHPLRVESVSWIAERKDVLCTAFFLLAIHFYISSIRSGAWRDKALVFIAMLAGLLSKPMLVTLPFVLVLLDRWPLKRWERLPELWQVVREKALLFALSVVFCFVAIQFQSQAGAVRAVSDLPISIRLQTAPVAYIGYLWNSLLPNKLSPFYNHPQSWPIAHLVVSLSLILTISILAVLIRKTRPWWLIGWLFYLGTLMPVIGLIQVGDQWMADRYTYIPMLGPLAALVAECTRLASLGIVSRSLVFASSVIICVTLSLATRQQIQVWKDSATVADAAIAIDGGHWSMRTNKAISLSQNGRMSEALEMFRQICIDFPNDAEAANNFGFTLLSMKRHREAVVVLEAAVRANPKNPKFRVNLGQALLGTGAREEALESFIKAAQEDPNDPAAPLFAAMAEMNSNPASAVRYAQRALDLSPHPAFFAMEVLANAKLTAGDRTGAVNTLRYASQIAKNSGNSALELGFRKKADSVSSSH